MRHSEACRFDCFAFGGGIGHQPKTKKGEPMAPLFLLLRNCGLDQPIGVLLELAPAPEVSTRITPD
jgi:hypothetical protein